MRMSDWSSDVCSSDLELGFGEPVPLSAEHGEGLAELYAALAPHVRPAETAIVETTNDGEPAPEGDSGSNETEDDEAEDDEADDPATPIQLAIVGRPNVGNSTLVNRLLGEERGLDRKRTRLNSSH